MTIKKYIISDYTAYDSDKQLWETYIGKDDENMTLLFSCWGLNKEESRLIASSLLVVLNN